MDKQGHHQLGVHAGAGAPSSVKRRALIAGAAALAAGLLAKRGTEPVESANGDIMHVGDALSGTAATSITYTNDTAPPYGMWYIANTGAADAVRGTSTGGATESAGVRGESDTGSGVVGSYKSPSPTVSSGNGVYGFSAGANGVRGISTFPGGNGVFGTADGGTTAYGVWGASDAGPGVVGESTAGIGVRGTSLNNFGVAGFATGSNAAFVTAGLYGASDTTYGIIGNTTAAGYSSLTAITASTGVAALAATSTNPNAYAAYFQGTTVVQGDFVAFGGAKSAAVRDASGQHRMVYCVESPESWFEDFGEGRLVNGRADVALDPVFTQIARTDTYHVFLTEHDVHNHLVVAKRTPTGFAVLADAEGAALKGKKVADLTGTFSWRVVAKRKDIAGQRLARFNVPKIRTPDPAQLPKMPARKPRPIETPHWGATTRQGKG